MQQLEELVNSAFNFRTNCCLIHSRSFKIEKALALLSKKAIFLKAIIKNYFPVIRSVENSLNQFPAFHFTISGLRFHYPEDFPFPYYCCESYFAVSPGCFLILGSKKNCCMTSSPHLLQSPAANFRSPSSKNPADYSSKNQNSPTNYC